MTCSSVLAADAPDDRGLVTGASRSQNASIGRRELVHRRMHLSYTRQAVLRRYRSSGVGASVMAVSGWPRVRLPRAHRRAIAPWCNRSDARGRTVSCPA